MSALGQNKALYEGDSILDLWLMGLSSCLMISLSSTRVTDTSGSIIRLLPSSIQRVSPGYVTTDLSLLDFRYWIASC
jgi:hypothetical protein